METWKRLLKKLFCPPPLPAVLLAAFGYGLLILVFALEIRDPVPRYASYLASAYALAVTCAGLPRLFRGLKKGKEKALGHPLAQRLRATPAGEKYLTDIHFRNRISLHVRLTVNLAYIVMKLSTGLYYRSAWLISLAVYYILLAVMRLSLLRYKAEGDGAAAFRVYRRCGFVLLLMNQALTGIVVFMVRQNRGFRYPGVLIYAMAAYAFYAVITAAVSIAKTRRQNSPILSATKAVNLVAALVSLLSLTTAMLAQFGGEDDPAFRRAMTGAVGGGVCTLVILMAAYMIRRANKHLILIFFKK